MVTGYFYHGGVPDLRPGDLLKPGHERRSHDGCPYCAARARGEAFHGLDPLAEHQDRVYFTSDRLYAKFYASLWGRGDLYRVEPVGDLESSDEDHIESFMAPAVQVIAVLERAVLLTNSERRRLFRFWGAAELNAGH